MAQQYLDNGFHPIPVRNKHYIPEDCTGGTGTVTPSKVAEWMTIPKWANAGVALRISSGVVVIDVDQYEDKHGFEQLVELEANLGPLPVTVTNTSRGKDSPSRQHFFLVPDDVPLASKAAPDVDILRYGHRFAVCYPTVHPKTGEQYRWYGFDGEPLDELPTPGDFEFLPEKWVEFLTADPVLSHEGFEGTISDWLDTLPAGAPSPRVRTFIEAIPTDKFTHDDVVRVTYNLVRLGSEREPGVRQALDTLYATWVRPPYDTPEYRSELLKALQGAIRKAGAPESVVPNLLYGPDTLNALPQFTNSGTEFMSMVMEEPAIRTEGVFAEARALLIREVLDAGLSAQQALTVAWHSKVGEQYRTVPDGLERLWREVEQVTATSTAEKPLATVTPINAHTMATGTIELLSTAERAFLAEQGLWWGTTYVEWAADRLRKTNAPYNRMNRLTALSLIFSPHVFLSPDGIRMDFNFFQMIVGGSSTGKTQSKNLLREVIKAYFPPDATPNIGGDLSKESLTKVLIQRDGQPSWLHRDDADGLLREVQGARGNWNEGLIQRWCDFFEGRVDPIYRQGDRETSGIEAHAFLVAHFVGVLKEVTAVADEKLWTSGLFPRFVFAIGEPADPEVTGVRLNLAVGAAATDGDPLTKQWAAEFSATIEDFGQESLSMGMENAAIDKFEQVTRTIQQYARRGSDDPRLEAVANRFGNNVLKAAGLAAAVEGFTEITLRHMLIALEQAEEWWANVVYMLEATNETPLSRKATELEETIMRNEAGTIPLADVHKRYRPMEESERIIRQLEVEERAVRDTDERGVKVLRIIKRRGRVAA